MGRHKKLRAAAPSLADAAVVTSTPCTVPPAPQVPAHPHKPKRRPARARAVDEAERMKALSAYTPQSSRGISPAVIAAGAPIVSLLPYEGWEVDRERICLLSDLLKADEAIHGTVDAARALRPENVDYFLSRRTFRSDNSFRTLRSLYYRFGRAMHPTLYPEQRIQAPRAKELQAPYTPDELARLYDFALATSPALSRRMLIVLDVIGGTGALTPELFRLCGNHIRRLSADPDRAVVTLIDRNGVVRKVPLTDQVRSRRLLRIAEKAGDERLLPYSRKQVVYYLQRQLAEHGHSLQLNAVRLRHTWLVDLLNRRVPAAAVMQLAGIGDAHTLAGLRRWIRTYDTAELAALLIEAAR